MATQLTAWSDERLLERMGSGNDDALAELYDRYGRLAFGLARRILGSESLAEDAVQEGFLAVWRGASGFSPERGAARAWLLTLVHRRAVDMVRKSARRPEWPTDIVPEAGPADDAADEAALLEERRRVQTALGRLSPDDRRLLELAYYGGLTQSELAERLEVPLGTIKSRTSSALSRLHTLLREPPVQATLLAWDERAAIAVVASSAVEELVR